MFELIGSKFGRLTIVSQCFAMKTKEARLIALENSDQMWRKLRSIVLCCIIAFPTYAQPDLKMASDTIITKKEFLANIYLLDGKKINLPVMEWFMQDYPSSYDAIQPALISDQLSVATYSVGTIFILGGLIVNNRDRDLSNNLIVLGGVAAGSGLLLQYVSGRFQKRAIRLYNIEVKKSYSQANSISVDIGLLEHGFGFRFQQN